MNTEILNIAIVIGMSILIALFTIYLIMNRKKAKYDEVRNLAILDEVRASFESQIYALNDRLVQSEERWKDVNHLLLRNESVGDNFPINKKRTVQYSDFLRANGISQNDLIVSERLIFVLTPFNDKYYEDYNVIRKTCTQQGLICMRGDENNIKGDIFPEMLKLIVKSNLVIANVNGRSPNVMYELGITQALDKTVILIASRPEELPIDIKSKKFLIYSSYNQLTDKLKEELKNHFIND